jgi:hypothetical protein
MAEDVFVDFGWKGEKLGTRNIINYSVCLVVVHSWNRREGRKRMADVQYLAFAKRDDGSADHRNYRPFFS